MTKITFELDKLKDFIDGMETTHYGRCGDYYYEEFRLNNEGVIEHRYYSFSHFIGLNEEWEPLNIKGEINDNL